MQLCKYKTGQTIVEWLLQVYSEIIMITLTGKDARYHSAEPCFQVATAILYYLRLLVTGTYL